MNDKQHEAMRTDEMFLCGQIAQLRKDLIYQQKLVRVLAEMLHARIQFDNPSLLTPPLASADYIIALAEAKVREEENRGK